MMGDFVIEIDKVATTLSDAVQKKIDFKTKPLGSLGVLECIAAQVALIQNSLTPQMNRPTMLVFAGDHGVVKRHPVSAFPQEVTAQMVANFLSGGAAINVFSRQNNLALKVIDAGVASDVPSHPDLIDAKVALGTADYTQAPAMTADQCRLAMERVQFIVTDLYRSGCNVVGFGEMGIGNTASASLLMQQITQIPLNKCVGKGTGLDKKGVATKIAILQNAIAKNGNLKDPFEVLAHYGGFEIAMIVGGILTAASLKMAILIDGFIIGAALLVAQAMNVNVLDYCICCHRSKEQAHHALLSFMNKKPLLDLGLRLGEGTGAALAFPLLKNAVAFLNEMATFDSAAVSGKLV